MTNHPNRSKTTAIARELLEHLKYAKKCMAWCREHHPNIQASDGIPVEIFWDETIERAEVILNAKS